MPVLSPVTDNCPCWISRRVGMTTEMISLSISTKVMRPSRNWNLPPLNLAKQELELATPESGQAGIGTCHPWIWPSRNWNLPPLNLAKQELELATPESGQAGIGTCHPWIWPSRNWNLPPLNLQSDTLRTVLQSLSQFCLKPISMKKWIFALVFH